MCAYFLESKTGSLHLLRNEILLKIRCLTNKGVRSMRMYLGEEHKNILGWKLGGEFWVLWRTLCSDNGTRVPFCLPLGCTLSHRLARRSCFTFSCSNLNICNLQGEVRTVVLMGKVNLLILDCFAHLLLALGYINPARDVLEFVCFQS